MKNLGSPRLRVAVTTGYVHAGEFSHTISKQVRTVPIERGKSPNFVIIGVQIVDTRIPILSYMHIYMASKQWCIFLFHMLWLSGRKHVGVLSGNV